jgi:hypothetical protein
MWLVNLIYWLHAFFAPVIGMGLIGLWISDSVRMFIIMLIIGGLAGIILAEYIRRKIGLSVFFARIYGPNKMDKQKED